MHSSGLDTARGDGVLVLLELLDEEWRVGLWWIDPLETGLRYTTSAHHHAGNYAFLFIPNAFLITAIVQIAVLDGTNVTYILHAPKQFWLFKLAVAHYEIVLRGSVSTLNQHTLPNVMTALPLMKLTSGLTESRDAYF